MVAELPGLNAYALREEQNAEASLLPQKEGKKFFLGHSMVFLLDF